jgi:hypothetical protein
MYTYVYIYKIKKYIFIVVLQRVVKVKCRTCLLLQALGSVMLGTTLFAVMGLYVVLVSVACTQLQKVQAALGEFRQQGQDQMHAILVRCVQHHQEVLK